MDHADLSCPCGVTFVPWKTGHVELGWGCGGGGGGGVCGGVLRLCLFHCEFLYLSFA